MDKFPVVNVERKISRRRSCAGGKSCVDTLCLTEADLVVPVIRIGITGGQQDLH